jgi:hypothetical protein
VPMRVTPFEEWDRPRPAGFESRPWELGCHIRWHGRRAVTALTSSIGPQDMVVFAGLLANMRMEEDGKEPSAPTHLVLRRVGMGRDDIDAIVEGLWLAWAKGVTGRDVDLSTVLTFEGSDGGAALAQALTLCLISGWDVLVLYEATNWAIEIDHDLYVTVAVRTEEELTEVSRRLTAWGPLDPVGPAKD